MERLQKVLARVGLGSRREIEDWIRAGQVRVNGRVAELGDRVAGGEAVVVGERRVELAPAFRTRALIYNKPAGEICTRKDPQGRTSVYASLPTVFPGRWLSVGRLDVNTQGLLLFTNDGELAHRLAHPGSNIDREYAVRVLGEVTPEILGRLRSGVLLSDGWAHFSDIQPAGGKGANSWYYVTLMEGRNREVRRLWEACGLVASRLKRVRFGPAVLPSSLSRGRWFELRPAEVAALCDLVGHPGSFPGDRRPFVSKALLQKSNVLTPYPGIAGYPPQG